MDEEGLIFYCFYGVVCFYCLPLYHKEENIIHVHKYIDIHTICTYVYVCLCLDWRLAFLLRSCYVCQSVQIWKDLHKQQNKCPSNCDLSNWHPRTWFCTHTQNSHQHTKKQMTYEYYICFIDFVSECIDFVFPPANEIILAIFHTFVNIRICKHRIRTFVAFVVGDDDCCAFSNVIQYTHIR